MYGLTKELFLDLTNRKEVWIIKDDEPIRGIITKIIIIPLYESCSVVIKYPYNGYTKSTYKAENFQKTFFNSKEDALNAKSKPNA